MKLHPGTLLELRYMPPFTRCRPYLTYRDKGLYAEGEQFRGYRVVYLGTTREFPDVYLNNYFDDKKYAYIVTTPEAYEDYKRAGYSYGVSADGVVEIDGYTIPVARIAAVDIQEVVCSYTGKTKPVS